MEAQIELYRAHGNFNWDQNVLAPILSKLALKGTERVLDLGCGSGETTFNWILPFTTSVYGVDAAPEMIEAARELLKTKDADVQSRCTLEVRDGQTLGDFDQPFDVCFTNAALHWMKKDPQAVADSVFKALKPGGRYVGEMGGHLNCLGLRSSLHRSFKARGLPINDPWWFPSVEDFSRVLEKAGFAIDYIELVPRPTPLKNGVVSWIRTFGEHFFKAARSDEEREAILKELEADLAVDMLDSSGKWTCLYSRLRFVAIKPGQA